MKEARPGWVGAFELSERDDEFHEPDAHPWYLEGVWFSFHVPERKMEGYVYLKFWPNQRVYGGGALVWDDRGTLPWDVPYFSFRWHEPWPEIEKLSNCRLPNGVGIECLEPLTRYHVTYQSRDLEVDMLWDAILPAFAQGQGDVPFLFAGHIDHPGRVTGRMNLRGEEIPLDCVAMRDRSWGPRVENPQLRMGYDHAANSDRNAFLALTSPKRDEDPIVGGYRLLDGELGMFVRGQRRLERAAAGYPTRIILEGEDELGRPFEAVGEVQGRMGFRVHHGIFNWLSYTRWEYDGLVGWGEDEDLWHPDLWRAYARNR